MQQLVGDENGVYARVVAHSVSEHGKEIATLEVQDHRFMLPEFNTHRLFSRNSGSSRAIPTHKQINAVMSNPALPVSWRAKKAGMQGGEALPAHIQDLAVEIWLEARDHALDAAVALDHLGVHKSTVNRLLEPFMWHRIIVTATEFDNFFAQRINPDAQDEIRVLAECMKAALDASTPTLLGPGQWHLPYIEDQDIVALAALVEAPEVTAREVSAARCARVSYLTHHGVRDVSEDLRLFNDLATAAPPHWSPMEHPATPTLTADEPTLGNFQGWVQLRHHPDLRAA